MIRDPVINFNEISLVVRNKVHLTPPEQKVGDWD